ncbi:MAG: proteasome-type protease [Burkholderiales bacterium]|jgi:putative proteasome-type protease|nr:proteasome-type protease [Burkholderiales bacterium]
MTYCVAIKINDGIIFASDSRTSASIDNIATFRKTHHFSISGEREIFLLNAGNLATTQEIISILRREIEQNAENNILTLESMFDVAKKVGNTIKTVTANLPPSVPGGVDFSCSFIVGGQIKHEAQRLFLVYPEGNFIEATRDTPFFQIGESKYGKPMLDRVINYSISISDALKCALVSFDSTMRSNLSVGLPIDLSCLTVTDKISGAGYRVATPQICRIDEHNKSYKKLSHDWREGLQRVFTEIPTPNLWEEK